MSSINYSLYKNVAGKVDWYKYVDCIYYICADGDYDPTYFCEVGINNNQHTAVNIKYTLNKKFNDLCYFKLEAVYRAIADAFNFGFNNILIIPDSVNFINSYKITDIFASLCGSDITIMNPGDINEDCLLLNKKAINYIYHQKPDFTNIKWKKILDIDCQKTLSISKVSVPLCVHKIDYVVTYVNSEDKNWQEEYNKYSHNNEPNRFRDWGTLQFHLRGIAEHMPWINNVYLVVSSESQVPEWLNRDEVKIVYHKDIIPQKYMPLFNSRSIELFLPYIKGLSEYWLYANDDMFVLKDMTPDMFYNNGKVICEYKNVPNNTTNYNICCINSFRLCMRDFNDEHMKMVKRVDRKYKKLFHTIHPFCKSTGYHLHILYKTYLYNSITKFREEKNVNQYIFGLYEYLQNNYINSHQNTSYVEISNLNILWRPGEACTLCINDNIKNTDRIDEYKTIIRGVLYEQLYNKSKYELTDIKDSNVILTEYSATKENYINYVNDNPLKVALCAIAKNENLYIREWVEWYKTLGICKIFLYDNNDLDGERFEEVINDYIEEGFVEVIDKRGVNNIDIDLLYNNLTNIYSNTKFIDNTCIKLNSFKLKQIYYTTKSNEINISNSEHIIISLTSYPSRIKYVKTVLESIINQDVDRRLYNIVLVLAIPEFPNKENDLPSDLYLYIKEQNVEIIWYEKNIRSHKKLMPTLAKYPNNPILIIDDDVYRPQGWLRMFIEDHIKYPTDILCGAVKQYLNKQLIWEDYNGPRKHTNAGNVCIMPNMYLTTQKPMNGFGGTLYPANTFSDERFFNEELMMKLSPTSDENWQWCFNMIENKNLRTTSKIYDYSKYTINGSQDINTSLYKVNNKRYNNILQTMFANLSDLKLKIIKKMQLINNKYCIATIVNDDFLPGAQTMIYSFLKHNSWFDGDIVILHSNKYSKLSEHSQEILFRLSNKIKFIKITDDKYDDIVSRGVIQTKFIPPIIKFEIFGLTDYDKILYLDADTLVIKNIIKLMTSNGDIIVLPHERDIIKQPKKWEGAEDINNGVIMINKALISKETVNDLINISALYNTNIEWYKSCPDQDIMSYYLLQNITKYNIQLFTNDFNSLKRVYMGNAKHINTEKIIHYIMHKPWNDNRQKQYIYKYIYKWWFKYYNEYNNIKLY